MPTKLISTPNRSRTGRMPNVADDLELLAEGTVNKGMITTIEQSDIPTSALVLAKNCVVRYDKTSTRPGNILFPITKPNSTTVLQLAVWSRNDLTVNLMRHTKNTLHAASAGTWTAYTSGTPLSGSDTDYFCTIVVNDRYFFANNGIDYIQEANSGASSYARLGNADKYKHIAGFGNRIVAANLVGGSPNPILIAWSGDFNFAEWDPLVDISAGSDPLVDVSDNFADPINGLFALENVLTILRERSIWTATKTASATAPFYFAQKVPNIGSDCPYSATAVPNGVVFVSYRLGSVFFFDINAGIKRIGLAIEDVLIPQITNVNLIFASYNGINNEYQLAIPSISGTVRVWRYNFTTEAWSYDEIANVTAISTYDYSASSTSIDELLGSISGLFGTIDSLGSTAAARPTTIYGCSSGEVLQESSTVIDDNGTAFTLELWSKVFTVPNIDDDIAQIRIYIKPLFFKNGNTGTITLSYSKDDGGTFKSYKTFNLILSQLSQPVMLKANKQVNARRFMFRLVSTDTKFDLTGYEVHIYPAGESKR